jgi:uncharacterized protein YaiI (UPF0178 family)
MNDQPQVWVDADSCPFKEEIISISKKFHLEITFVSNMVIQSLQGRHGIHTILSDDTFDAVDDLIVHKIKSKDFAVTKDLMLAKRLLEKQVFVCGFQGKAYESNIEEAMAHSQLHTLLRDEQGGFNQTNKKKQKASKHEKSAQFKNSFHNFLDKSLKTRLRDKP